MENEDYENSELIKTNIDKYGYDYFKEALRYYRGDADYLQDYNKALKLFKKSTSLGNIESYLYIGRMHLYGEGCSDNVIEALKYFKEGAEKGNYKCFAEMGIIYLANYYKNVNIEDGIKCWKKYFESIKINEVSNNDIWYFNNYIELIRTNNLTIEFIDVLSFHKQRMIDRFNSSIEQYENNKNLSYREYHIDRFVKNKQFIIVNLKEPEETIYSNYCDKLNMEIEEIFELSDQKDKTVLCGQVINGEISVGDKVRIINNFGDKESEILFIESNRKSKRIAYKGEPIGILVGGNIKEYSFIGNKAFIVNLQELEETIYGNYVDELNMEIEEIFELSDQKDKTVLCGQVINGEISVGDKVHIINNFGDKETEILFIESNRKAERVAYKGDRIGILVGGNIKEYSFIGKKAFIKK